MLPSDDSGISLEAAAACECVLADNDFGEAETEVFGDQVNPVAAAARERITAAMKPTGLREQVVRQGAVVALVVDDIWFEDVVDAYYDVVHDSLVPCRDRYGSRAPASILCKSNDTAASVRDHEQRLGDAIADGRGAVIAVSDLAGLSRGVRLEVDVVVSVPPLDVGGLIAVARRVGKGSSVPAIDPALPACLGPQHISLAVRPGDTAEDFVGRLIRIVDADHAGAPEKAGAPRWTLDRLHGQPEVRAFGEALAADLTAFRAGDLPWSDVAPGVLLSGPPGCGKTLAAQALAHACGIPLIATSYSEWQASGDGNLGSVTKAIKARFAEARCRAPCVLFVDELDSVRARGGSKQHDDWWSAIVNTLLEELDGVAGRDGVVVIGASNYPGKVDPALRRSGRLDKEIRMGLPDVAALEAILNEYVGDDLPADDLRRLAVAAQGGTGADVARWTRGARQKARHARRRLVVDDVLTEIRAGMRDRRPEEARRVAVHEAGHAVLASFQHPGSVVSVTVRSAGVASGGVETLLPRGDDSLRGAEGLLRFLMAGRAAEEVVLGEAGAGSGGGAGSDLATATVLAASMEVAWGFRGLTWRGDPTAESVPHMLAFDRRLEERVEQRLQTALAEARDVLRRHRRALDALVAALLEQETLVGADAEAIVSAHPPVMERSSRTEVPRIPPMPMTLPERGIGSR